MNFDPLITDKPQHHIRCLPGDVADKVLLPGDPKRAELIAGLLDDARHVATNREYTTYTGTYRGMPVSVTSTGIGCPSAAIAIEELTSVGAKTLIRTGTSGSMSPDVGPGEVIVGTAAIREEGTGTSYLPIEFPAVADLDLTYCLRAAAETLGLPVRVGVLHSKDSFYSHRDPDRLPVAQEMRGKRAAWMAGGALASEMETSTLFVLGSMLRVRTGSICLVASSQDASTRLTPEESERLVEKVVTAALDALVLDESNAMGGSTR